MHRNAIANDLRYLHRSLEQRRHSTQSFASQKAATAEAAAAIQAPIHASSRTHANV